MNDIDKRAYYLNLYDIYKELLTIKQQEYFECYYFNDYSLSEVADVFKVSRNAISLNINKTLDKLDYLEDKINKYQLLKEIEELKKQKVMKYT